VINHVKHSTDFMLFSGIGEAYTRDQHGKFG